MAGLTRFGRKLRLPSTAQIKNDLVEMGRADSVVVELRKHACGGEELNGIIDGLIAEHQISGDRAKMLMDRFGRGQASLASAGSELKARKHDYGVG